ncbi:hypothetical protein [Novosphingobium sp. AP12]|uniref:hypothetical protein n=1 Tax=Novosphingobium sp. AP12 TaxID=1144305 RepID=UPI000272103D|nr:hypothetical protein [Novosphingobium sp. AP12]EJL24031.1 hypothetical protein PMI02_03952 [Novosphingobium sp. AP12]
MAAGKLLLLLVAGGLAGAAFAGMTTGVMRPYRDREAVSAARPLQPQANDGTAPYATPPANPSWLDEGVSLLDSPAWPFGHGSQDEDASAYPAPGDDAPYGYGQRERDDAERYDDDPRYDDGRWDREDRPRPGYRTFDGYAANAYPPASVDEGGSSDRMERRQPAQRQGDTASDAASRAADVAQDVIAAEHGS